MAVGCLKCGKKTKDEQVFCETCLQSMEAYPVKPEVHIQLPNRKTGQQPKKSGKKRRNLSADEQVVFLRSRIRRLKVLAALLALLLVMTGVMLLHTTLDEKDLNIGKNYTFGNPFD